MESFK